MKSGQILILVLLIVVVSLAVGLSVASRNLTNLKISTQAEESQRAFSAAEGGVEDVLSKLSAIGVDIANNTNSDPLCTGSGDQRTCTSAVGDLSASVVVKGRNVYIVSEVKLGDVAQVNLDGYTGTVKVEWKVTPDAPLELTLVCQNSADNCLGGVSSGVYSQNRYAYQAPGSTGPQQGFQNCSQSLGICSINLPSIASTTGAKILRVKPFNNAVVDLTVSGVLPNNLPTQIYEINSVAKTALGITRRVKVTRTALPALPAVFDYVLYSEGDIVK